MKAYIAYDHYYELDDTSNLKRRNFRKRMKRLKRKIVRKRNKKITENES